MGRDERRELIREIEKNRKSKVITYITGDRAPIPAQIGDDAVRHIYQQLRNIGHVRRLDLFLYTRGGAIDVPWRLVSAFRRAAENWNILIPFRANSAGTLIALGADDIVLGQHGELGPIDPSLSLRRLTTTPNGESSYVQDNISVEDVMAFVRFIQEKCKLSEQESFASALGKLIDRVDAVALGSIYRNHSHIRDVATRILESRPKRASRKVIRSIVATLAERVYAHGHAIGLTAATELGLPVKAASKQLDVLMWRLLETYEHEMGLLTPLDPAHAVGQTDRHSEEACIAIVESVSQVNRFVGTLEVKARRQLPQNLQVSLSLNLQLPAGIDPANLGQQAQEALQAIVNQAQQAVIQQAQGAVQQALAAQAPLIGAEAGFRNGNWLKED